MARLNAREVLWEKVEVLGKEGLFVDLRVDRKTVPEGYHMYEVRHSDNDWGEPVEIGEWIMVNFFGTLLTKEPFELEKSTAVNNAYLWLENPEDFAYLGESVEFGEG